MEVTLGHRVMTEPRKDFGRHVLQLFIEIFNKKVMEDAGLKKNHIDEVVLVGRSTRILIAKGPAFS
eukprot:9414910-Karenia_brevis.AAC.1